ncbi:MAG: 4Fe-4S binding protein, partial [Calditrichia bacterium]
MRRLRQITQLSFLIFFALLFLQARYPYEVRIPSDIFLRFTPLGPLFYFIDTLYLPIWFWPAVIILLLTPLLGRFFCGWICPLGTSLDIFSRLFGRRRMPRDYLSRYRWIKFAVLFSTIFMALFSLHLWSYFDPLAIFTRVTTVIFYPLFTLLFEMGLPGLAKISFLESPAFAAYDWYKAVLAPEPQAYYQSVFWIALLVFLIFGLEALSRRTWCRLVCPAGALLGLLSQFRFYERIVGESCPQCNLCQRDCKMNAIPAGNVFQTNKTECIECFNCGDNCPPKVKAITYRFRLQPYHTTPDYSRRQFLGTIAAGAAGVGLLSIGLSKKAEAARKIRPPGALPEAEFNDRCIRCLECVRICSSNGACLQPADFEFRIIELWTPVARMREGYCEYNCNLCGQVCP